MKHLILYCRPGFENECAAEIQDRATVLGWHGYVKAKPGSGFIVFTPIEPGGVDALARQLDFRGLIFARQLLISPGLLKDLPVTDRISPVLAALEGMVEQVSDVWVETADTDAAKALSGFCRSITPPLRQALKDNGYWAPDNLKLPRLHLLFLSATAVYPALSRPDNAAPWLMGIPRLKVARGAPSRSALKLEEALLLFLTPEERERRLAPGMCAVDLGAAPGGWSWQLVRRHVRVIAVDNGALTATLLESGLVEHQRVDGFRYRPPRAVDWMVCDMVEKPARIARLAGRWLARGDCRESIFNLKLPMKQRYAEVRRCEALIARELHGRHYQLAIKQLYHDREEVTAHLCLLS